MASRRSISGGLLASRLAELEKQVARHEKALLRMGELEADLRGQVQRLCGRIVDPGSVNLATQQAIAARQVAEANRFKRERRERAERAAAAPTAMANAVDRAKRMIREHAQSDSSPGKAVLQAEIMEKITGLSIRGFNHAWREAAPPEWKRQGRRRRNHAEKPSTKPHT